MLFGLGLNETTKRLLELRERSELERAIARIEQGTSQENASKLYQLKLALSRLERRLDQSSSELES